MRLPCQRDLFDIPDDVAYLNCGYMSPLMKRVREAAVDGLSRKAHPWEIVPGDFFTGSDALRAAFARLINARADDIAIVPAVSYGVSTAASNLPLSPGQYVIVVEDQFPSNVYPWRERAREAGARVRTVPRPPGGRWTPAVLDAVDGDTAIVALPHCHWTDGTLIDLVAVGSRCREVGAALVVGIFWFFMTYTRTGRAIRAVSQDETGALIVGIGLNGIMMLTMALSCALAAIAGAGLLFMYPAYPAVGLEPLYMAWFVVILSGLGNVLGAVMGAFMVALLKVLTVEYIGAGWDFVVPSALIILILIFKPSGIFGSEVRGVLDK